MSKIKLALSTLYNGLLHFILLQTQEPSVT